MTNFNQDSYGPADEDGLTAEGIEDERYLTDRALDSYSLLDSSESDIFWSGMPSDGFREDDFGLPLSARMNAEEQEEFDQAAEALQGKSAFGPDF